MNEEKRSSILKAAEQEFSRQGYQAASVAGIAAQAGVAVGTVYAYFQSKEALFEAVRQPELKNYNPAKEERKSEILKAALCEFGKNGYSATTMDAIADACGCNKAIIYQYFETKEELFTAIFHETKFSFPLENTRSLGNASLYDLLQDLGRTFLSIFDDPNRVSILRIVLSETGRFPHIRSLMYENTIQVMEEKIAEILAQLNQDGLISELDFRLAARAYIGLLYSFVLTDVILNPNCKHFQSDEIVSFAADVFSKGMKP